eukprot:261429-Pelagomonas_calceolata.AAC.1
MGFDLQPGSQNAFGSTEKEVLGKSICISASQILTINMCKLPRILEYKVYKVYKDKAFSQEVRLLACS